MDHTKTELISGVPKSPKLLENKKIAARKLVARTYRTWPCCKGCGKELEIAHDEKWGDYTIILACPSVIRGWDG